MADGKWIAGLRPETPVAEAARAVFSTRFAVVSHYLPLAVESPYADIEYVHQLRVGTRRAGAALRVFADCVPGKLLKAAKRSLRAIRRAAGDARDWDVFRTGLATSKALASAAGKPAGDFLTGYAFGERSAAQARLEAAAATAGPEFAEVAAELPGAVQEPNGGTTPVAFGTFAGLQFGELLAVFEDAVAASPTDPIALHQLRILGKRVRYALEIFAECFPPAFKETVYPAVERAQEVLGEIQDAAVGRDRLTELRDRLKLAAPGEWPRVQKGFESLMQSTRAKIPAGRKAFQVWRGDWKRLTASVKAEIAAFTVTA